MTIEMNEIRIYECGPRVSLFIPNERQKLFREEFEVRINKLGWVARTGLLEISEKVGCGMQPENFGKQVDLGEYKHELGLGKSVRVGDGLP
jgi:hypothetical protein